MKTENEILSTISELRAAIDLTQLVEDCENFTIGDMLNRIQKNTIAGIQRIQKKGISRFRHDGIIAGFDNDLMLLKEYSKKYQ